MTIDQKCVDTLRLLSADAIQRANSGHPGMSLGAAPAMYALYNNVFRSNPKNPVWRNRDRFALSAGHASALLYSVLHLYGYDMSIDDLKAFRQFGSIAPGHPERGKTPGVEVSTGPLGQGVANAVGMALAETMLAEKFNRPGFNVVDHYTFALCGDGCVMEGVSGEAASFAGAAGLGKLILIYDSNGITIEGDTSVTFTEDVMKRFDAYGWQTIKVHDGNDVAAITDALKKAKDDESRPTLIEIKTLIGFGSPNKQGKASSHGEPLGADEVALTRKNLGWPYKDSFFVPDDAREHARKSAENGARAENAWNRLFAEYETVFPELAREWKAWFDDVLPVDFRSIDEFWRYNDGDAATRASSGEVLNRVVKYVPNMAGGSADLAPSTKAVMSNSGYYSKTRKSGFNIHFGVREFAMTAIANGIAAHGGLRPYIAGFFVFSDYMKPALRMSALMRLPIISILTHDSIGVGEDGPTHQPVEQLAGFRSLPGLAVMRPCDASETAAAWVLALERNAPSVLVLSRQNLPKLVTDGRKALYGAHVAWESAKWGSVENETPDLIIISTGSEVAPSVAAAKSLCSKDIACRVVSMMSQEIFEEQSSEYKETILPKNVKKRLVVEAAHSFGWHKYAGDEGDIISVDEFGVSAPASAAFDYFGVTAENIERVALRLLAYRRGACVKR
ncbi:MAG: transketolase [Clostridiales bacterium]|jgi:transketolase|nr:transketolase [Clostridiales bacterium]